MVRRNINLMFFVVGIVLILGACGASDQKENTNDLLQADWEEISKQAADVTVNMYMWGGSDSINKYIDEWVAPRLKEQYDVTLKRVPMNDTRDTINKLLAEKQAGKEKGSIDIMWMNGENFRISKENELLYGSFASLLPNVQRYIDLDSPDTARDFGLDTEGMEAPWGKAQFVFVYDAAKIEQPPTSMEALKQWVKENPGKFTYPAPPDFTGSAFVRHAMYETAGGHEPFLEELSEEELLGKLDPLWTFLNEIEPYLWREGTTYPESLAKLEQLYADGDVWMSMGYDPARASNLIENGVYPDTSRTFVLDNGTLANTHYLAIPYNAPNPAGAMVAINYLLSPEAQIAKYDPKHWGESMSINPDKLSEADQQMVAAIDRGPATLPAEVLARHRLPEIPSEYVSVIEKGWIDHVAKK